MSTIELQNTNVPQNAYDLRWTPKAYRCHVCTIREDDGSFSVIVLNLPGCGSCGDTKEEALKNVREAILGVVESYIKDGQQIPWQDSTPEDIPGDAELKWILVNA